ncbi:MAG: NnrU family protein, partial [Rhizobiales bacterium 39-66-18]
MYMMLFGLVLLLGVHVLISLRGVRAQLIARLGEGQYKGFFSLVAVSGLLLTAYGFALWRAAGSAPVWDPPLFMRHITMLLMLFAAIAGV